MYNYNLSRFFSIPTRREPTSWIQNGKFYANFFVFFTFFELMNKIIKRLKSIKIEPKPIPLNDKNQQKEFEKSFKEFLKSNEKHPGFYNTNKVSITLTRFEVLIRSCK